MFSISCLISVSHLNLLKFSKHSHRTIVIGNFFGELTKIEMSSYRSRKYKKICNKAQSQMTKWPHIHSKWSDSRKRKSGDLIKWQTKVNFYHHFNSICASFWLCCCAIVLSNEWNFSKDKCREMVQFNLMVWFHLLGLYSKVMQTHAVQLLDKRFLTRSFLFFEFWQWNNALYLMLFEHLKYLTKSIVFA